jgi:signal transduction histidine kinase
MTSSLKLRLAVGLSLSLLLLLGGQYWLVSGAIRATAEDYVASRLRHDSESLLAALRWAPDGPRLAATDTIYRRPYSGHYFRIQAGERSLRSRSLWEADLPLPEVAVGASRRLHVTGPQDQPLLVRVAAFREAGRTVRIAVGEDLTPLNADLAAFQWRYGLVSAAVAAVLLGLQWLLVALGLRPLRRLQGEVAALERGEREALSEDVPAEVRPLVTELNRLLGVLGERLERSRNALGNLAHALKAPLTRLFQAAETAPVSDDPALHEQILEPARTIRERIDRELGRARLAAGSPGQRFDPGRDIPGLIRAVERIHADRELTIAYHGPDPGIAYGDREDLMELVGNLLDNACKWAASEATVTAALEGGLTVTVADDGPGVPPDRRDRLTRRGARLDEAGEGHGLGLAIAGDIVAAYGGELTFGESAELGGLQVTAFLPG